MANITKADMVLVNVLYGLTEIDLMVDMLSTTADEDKQLVKAIGEHLKSVKTQFKAFHLMCVGCPRSINVNQETINT